MRKIQKKPNEQRQTSLVAVIYQSIFVFLSPILLWLRVCAYGIWRISNSALFTDPSIELQALKHLHIKHLTRLCQQWRHCWSQLCLNAFIAGGLVGRTCLFECCTALRRFYYNYHSCCCIYYGQTGREFPVYVGRLH